jgi:hypothetical protein
MNAGTGRAAARSQFAIALTTGIAAGRSVMRSRHSKSLGVASVIGALTLSKKRRHIEADVGK